MKKIRKEVSNKETQENNNKLQNDLKAQKQENSVQCQNGFLL